MCDILTWLSTKDNWKDFIIPLLGSILGIIGAYLVMLHQIKKQRHFDDMDMSNNQSLLRSVYEINLNILCGKVKKTVDPLKNHLEFISKNGLDFYVSITEFNINTFDVMAQIDYVKLYESYRPIFTVSKNSLFSEFVNSYDSYKRINYLIPFINTELQNHTIYKNELEVKLVINHQEFFDLFKLHHDDKNPTHMLLKNLIDKHFKSSVFSESLENYKLLFDEIFSVVELHKSKDLYIFEIMKNIKNSRFLLHHLSNKNSLLEYTLKNVCDELPKLLETIQSFINKVQNEYKLIGSARVTYI